MVWPRATASDHYQVLCVPESATAEQIKAAYRRKALRLHPDKNPQSEAAEERFKDCGEAYAVLSNAERRFEYDSLRLRESTSVTEMVGGLISELLGRRGRRRRAGSAVKYSLRLSFAEAALGVRRKIEYWVGQECAGCDSSGAAPDGLKPCPTCQGRGERGDARSLLPLRRPCPQCAGNGKTVARACRHCDGVGMVELKRELVATIPPATKDGDTRVVNNMGEPGTAGGVAGDLRLVIRVDPDPLLSLDGDDVHLELPLTLANAALGTSAEVPTLDGNVWMKIPPGTQSGRIFRLRGRGVRRRGSRKRGDQLVRVSVETPSNIEAAQRQSLQALDASCGPSTMPIVEEYRARLLERTHSAAEAHE
jgi:molecular chaperone DnaJ